MNSLQRIRGACVCALCMLVAFCGAVSAAEPVGVADEKLAACISRAVSKAGVASAAALTSLTCNGKGIGDAAGINALVNLESLSLFGNRLTSIELNALGKLKVLNLANNTIKRVDLSQNVELEMLYLFGNQLQRLDLRQTTQLVKLKAEKNALQMVEFGSMPKLAKVYLFDNQMEDIKVDTLTGLRFIDVRSNPMPDPVYDYLDAFDGVKASHDGNTEDWK